MWLSDAIRGRPARSNRRFNASARSNSFARRAWSPPHVPHAGQRGRHGHRRQRGGEDEPRRGAADEVDHLGVAGDVAAVAAERLRQCALDDVDPVRHAVALADAAAVRAIHADRVHLVEIGHRAITRREVADRADRGDVGVHRIHRLEGDQLRRGGGAARNSASRCAMSLCR